MMSIEEERICRTIDQRARDQGVMARAADYTAWLERGGLKEHVEWIVTMHVNHGNAVSRIWGGAATEGSNPD